MECLGRYTFIVMTSVILSGGVKMSVEHGMLWEVYIFCHDFCHTFRSSMECLGMYTCLVMTSLRVDDQDRGRIIWGAAQPPVGNRTDSKVFVALCACTFNEA